MGRRRRHHRSVANGPAIAGARGGPGERTARVTRRRLGLAALALGAGVAIGLAGFESGLGLDRAHRRCARSSRRPCSPALARDRPWLWALLVGLPTPILDIVRTGNSGSVLALGFAAAGAAVGWAVRRAS